MNPSVSVVMVLRNAEQFLSESIQSILDQSFEDFEFIIIDYGSKDRSKAIVRSYAEKDSRIKFDEIPACALPEARNAGCCQARGRYIAVMDADDISLPDRLSREVDYMERHPNVALLGGGIEWITAAGHPFHVSGHPVENSEIQQELLSHNVFWHPTTMMRTEAFFAVGGYRPVMVCAHDYDLAVRIAERFTCANLHEVVLRYRVHRFQLTSDKQEKQILCKLATQVSAAARRNGQVDPLNAVREITPAVLSALGVTEKEQKNAAAIARYDWVLVLVEAGEYSTALKGARQIWKSGQSSVTARQISEVYLQVAAIDWMAREIWRSVIEIGQAVMVRPILIGRPLKSFLHKLGVA